MKLVNSSFFGLPRTISSIKQATPLVGLNAVKSIAISASLHKIFHPITGNGAFNLKIFWYHSLNCGILARRIAQKNTDCDPDEAFLAGLLHDMGRLVLWLNFPKQYPLLLSRKTESPRQLLEYEVNFGGRHTEVGACLLEHWNLDARITDCARYHHEPVQRMQSAFPLLQTVFAADCLSSGKIIPCPEDCESLQALLNYSSLEIERCLLEAREELKEVADSLNIPIEEPPFPESLESIASEQEVEQELTHEIRDISLLLNSLQGLMNTQNAGSILKLAGQELQLLFNLDFFYFFLYDSHKKGLVGHSGCRDDQAAGQQNVFIPINSGNNLLAEAMNSGKSLNTFTGQGPLSILEEQLIRLSGQEGLFCLPMIVHGEPIGLLVLALSQDRFHLLHNNRLLRMFSRHLGFALHAALSKEATLKAVQAKSNEASSLLARKIIHEVNSPLTIIKNYLKILDSKLKKQEIEQSELSIINAEIDRIAGLIRQLHPGQEEAGDQIAEVEPHTVLYELVRLLQDSYLQEKQIRIHLDLTPSRPKVRIDENSLKQVFLNLMQNAAEAMDTGGNLTIRSRCVLAELMGKPLGPVDGPRGYLEITFIDDGPGIPKEMQDSLFEPFQTSKGQGHAGLGLSLCYEIVKKFNGRLSCQSNPGEKTRFLIELPVIAS